ncbi:MAG TPA: hypothetical protein PKY59_07785 [Pyrinomonadaceae bacterium]|nr:hypothetical protein [Pyrinomonadaceae bacterium]
MDNFDEVEKLWLEFYQLPFPAGFVGEEIKGICVTTLDTFTAGCIDTFVSEKGQLEKKKKLILIECQKELEIVVENLMGEGKKYFESLLILANKILQMLNSK